MRVDIKVGRFYRSCTPFGLYFNYSDGDIWMVFFDEVENVMRYLPVDSIDVL